MQTHDKQTYHDKQMRLDLNYFHRIFNMGCFDGVIENNWVRSANSHPPPGPCASCAPHVVIVKIHLVFRTWAVI